MSGLLCAVVMLVAWTAAGAVVLRAVGATPKRGGDALVEALSVGLGVCGLLSLALAWAGWLRPAPFVVGALLALVLGGWEAARILGRFQWRSDGLRLAAVAVGAVVLATALVTYATPPVGGDQTKYQLAYPRLYALAGGLVPSTSVWGQQQFLQNFVYAAAFATGGETVARLCAALVAVLAAGALAGLLRRHVAPAVAAVGAAAYFSLPIVWSQMFRAGSDMTLVLFAVLAVSALLDWWASGREGDLWRTALFAGCAAGTKVMGLLVPTLVGLGVLMELAATRPALAVTARRALGYGAIVLGICLPFYARNVAETGNPLYPFGFSAFGGAGWSAEASEYLDHYYNQYQTAHASKREATPYRGWDVLRFPWDVTMHPESFELSARQTLDAGPLALAFVPAILLVRRRRRVVWTIAAIGLAFGTIVAGAAWPHPRYIFPGMTLCFAAAIAGAGAVLGRRGVMVLLLASCVGNLALTTRLLRPMWPDQARVALGRMSVEDFMRKYERRWAFWSAANPLVGAGGRVLVLEKIPHPYYIETPFVMASYLEQGWVDYRHIDSPQELATVARGMGITHVSVAVESLQAAGDPYEAHVSALWRGLVTSECDPLLERNGFALHALRPGTGTARRGNGVSDG